MSNIYRALGISSHIESNEEINKLRMRYVNLMVEWDKIITSLTEENISKEKIASIKMAVCKELTIIEVFYLLSHEGTRKQYEQELKRKQELGIPDKTLEDIVKHVTIPKGTVFLNSRKQDRKESESQLVDAYGIIGIDKERTNIPYTKIVDDEIKEKFFAMYKRILAELDEREREETQKAKSKVAKKEQDNLEQEEQERKRELNKMLINYYTTDNMLEMRKKQLEDLLNCIWALEKIRTSEARVLYARAIRDIELKKIYDHSHLKDLDSVKILEERPHYNTQTHTFMDYDTAISIRKIGTIFYQTGVNIQTYIEKYLVTKTKGKKVTSYTCYGNLIIAQLTEKTFSGGRYREYILHQLLSDDSLRHNCAWNGGYLGQVMEMSDGEFSNGEFSVYYMPDELSVTKKIERMKDEKERENE